MRIETIGKTQQPITCDGCDHPILKDQLVLSDKPEHIPEDFPRGSFRHFHIHCHSCGANDIPCYQLYASRQDPFTAQANGKCDWCGHSIHAGQDVLRDSFLIWNTTEDTGDNEVASGGLAGMASPPKYQGPIPFKDLPIKDQNWAQTAGLGNGRGYRTPAEAEYFFNNKVPYPVRVLKDVREYRAGKHASHIEPVAKAPGKAKISSNIVLESPQWNLKRSAANMKPWEKVRAHTMNGE